MTCVSDDLNLECLNAFSQRVAVVEQSFDRLSSLLGNGLIRIHEHREFLEFAYAFWNGQPEFRRQAAHGVG